ncbi:MAG: hypothetical protein LBU34_15665 [Planctomycetaceae bacterium]|jgi:hypothetical protein|nr:hypothetical protein [Planctomycetaceae bacterium]
METIFAQMEVEALNSAVKFAEYGNTGICILLIFLAGGITYLFINLQKQNNTTLATALMELKTSNVAMSGAINSLSTEIRTLALMKRKKIDISENNSS